MRVAQLQNAPQWLKEAAVEDEDVEIIDGRVVWKSGKWYGGIWDGGVWHDGAWIGGIWEGGKWYGGIWYSGLWKGGLWEGGIWEGGMWENGLWEDGLWIRGTWMDGLWIKGTWQNGIWRDGEWAGGEWKSGTWEGGRKTMGANGIVQKWLHQRRLATISREGNSLWIDIGYVRNAVPATYEEALRIADDYRTWDCRWEEEAIRLAAKAARAKGLKYKVTCRSGKWSLFTLIQEQEQV